MNGNSFFIVGVQRSGTTLLQSLLSKHPQVLMQERSIGFRIVTCFNNFYELLPYNLLVAKKEFQKWLIRNDDNGRLAEILDVENLEQDVSFRELIKLSISKKLVQNEKIIWGDKSPNLQHFANDIFFLMPEAKMIHIVRDGRANAYSMAKRGYKNLRLSAQEWMDGNIYGMVNQDILSEEKYKILKYENLLSNPEKELKSICEFLGIPFAIEMLDLTDKRLSEEKKYVKSYFDTSKIDKWKQQLSPKELKRIEKIQGPLLKQLGYKLETNLEDTDFRQLTLRMRILINQWDNLKLLFKRKRVGMKEKELIEMDLSFKNRAFAFLTVLVRDLCSLRIFKSFFSRYFYKEKIFKKGKDFKKL